jgi:hypothetical protein
LRWKIWGHAACLERIIEVDAIRGSQEIHGVVRIAPNSRNPPAILHTSRESRAEALKFYELKEIETRRGFSGQASQHMYFNSQADILYFGEQSSILTLETVLRKELDIQRIAVVYSWHWAEQGDDGGDPMSLRLLQLLHGIDPETMLTENSNLFDHSDNPFPGFQNLKEVSLVLPSNLVPYGWGGNDRPVHFETALQTAVQATEAFNLDMVRVRASPYRPARILKLPTSAELEALEQLGEIETLSEKRWIGASKPTFRFVSLGHNDTIYDVIRVPCTGNVGNILWANGHALTRSIVVRTGCIIIHANKEYSLWRDEEGNDVFADLAPIHFFGPRDTVIAAQNAFREDLRAALLMCTRVNVDRLLAASATSAY